MWVPPPARENAHLKSILSPPRRRRCSIGADFRLSIKMLGWRRDRLIVSLRRIGFLQFAPMEAMLRLYMQAHGRQAPNGGSSGMVMEVGPAGADESAGSHGETGDLWGGGVVVFGCIWWRSGVGSSPGAGFDEVQEGRDFEGFFDAHYVGQADAPHGCCGCEVVK